MAKRLLLYSQAEYFHHLILLLGLCFSSGSWNLWILHHWISSRLITGFLDASFYTGKALVSPWECLSQRAAHTEDVTFLFLLPYCVASSSLFSELLSGWGNHVRVCCLWPHTTQLSSARGHLCASQSFHRANWVWRMTLFSCLWVQRDYSLSCSAFFLSRPRQA